MPGQRSADKETLSFYVPRTLGARIKKKAISREETVTDFVVSILNKSVDDVELGADDYERIAIAIREYKNKQRIKREAEKKS